MQGLLDYFVVVYLDDILIYLKDASKYHSYVKQVLDQLRKHKLYISLSKCSFDVEEVEFLGFLVGKNSVRKDPEKICTIID